MRRSLLATLAAGLLVPALASLPSSPADATVAVSSGTSARAANPDAVVVDGYGDRGLTVVDTMGYDLKQPSARPQFTKAAADTLFGTSGTGLFNLVRIPVLAAEAHPKAGVANIRRTSYADTVAAVKRIDGYNRVKVFASLRLVGNYNNDKSAKSFPAWVKPRGVADPARYSQLLFDYLSYMDNVEGIEIDYLGIDNERYLNDGKLIASRYSSTVSRLKTRLADWNKKNPNRQIKRPTFVASDNYRPDTEWFADLGKVSGGWSNAGVVGVHWYSKLRTATRGTNPKVPLRTDFTTVANAARQRSKPVWENEYHFNDDSLASNEYALNVRGVLGATDNTDRRTSGFTWWSYSHYCAGGQRNQWCDESPRARLTQAMAVSMSGAKILPAPADRDGKGNAERTFVSRTFRKGNQLTVWIVNDTPTTYSSQGIRVPGWNVPSGYAAGSAQQWRRTATSGANNLGYATTTVRASAADDVVRVTIPARSITVVRLGGVTTG